MNQLTVEQVKTFDTKDVLRNITENESANMYYMNQLYHKVCDIIWDIYLKENRGKVKPSRTTFQQKEFSEFAPNISGMTAKTINVLRKPRGNSEVIIRTILFLDEYGIDYKAVFYDPIILHTAYGLSLV